VRARKEWPFWVAGVVVAAALYVFVWPSRPPAASPSPGKGGIVFACAYIGTPTAEDRQRCLNVGRELARRSRPSQFQLDQARQQMPAIATAVLGAADGPAAHTPDSTDVANAEIGLAQLGFSDYTVRLAGPDDLIANEGELYWAVRNGEACILGHSNLLPTPEPDQVAAGVLPDGSC
jgi:hypothetical protein